MYEGSMYGAGIAVFAVWGYVIAHTKGSCVELNPRKLADTLGGKIEEIEKAIEFLTRPDPQSRFKEQGGRRMVKEGEFQYFLPSWEHYRKIRNAEEWRDYNTAKQRQYRALKKGKPLPGEEQYLKAQSRGAGESELNRITESCLPDENPKKTTV